MKLKRRQGPTTVFSAMAFPIYLILVMDDRHDQPLPMYSTRDGHAGCHVEYTKAQALRYLDNYRRMRATFPARYPHIVGGALMTVHSPDDLRQLAEHMDPKPDGFFYDTHFNLSRDEWVSTFVPWEKLHGPFKPGLG